MHTNAPGPLYLHCVYICRPVVLSGRTVELQYLVVEIFIADSFFCFLFFLNIYYSVFAFPYFLTLFTHTDEKNVMSMMYCGLSQLVEYVLF